MEVSSTIILKYKLRLKLVENIIQSLNDDGTEKLEFIRMKITSAKLIRKNPQRYQSNPLQEQLMILAGVPLPSAEVPSFQI